MLKRKLANDIRLDKIVWEAPSSSSARLGSQEGATAVQPEAEVEE